MCIHASLLWSYAGQGENKGFRWQKMTKKVLLKHINGVLKKDQLSIETEEMQAWLIERILAGERFIDQRRSF